MRGAPRKRGRPQHRAAVGQAPSFAACLPVFPKDFGFWKVVRYEVPNVGQAPFKFIF